MKFKLYNLSKKVYSPENANYIKGFPVNDEYCYDMSTAVGAADGDTL
jgi:hypothetical protein